MKILCETSLTRRNNPQIKGKFQKSTIAIGRKSEKSGLVLILITSNNKAGVKYGKSDFIYILLLNYYFVVSWPLSLVVLKCFFSDLTNNLSNIFRKFVDEGKCTISFKLPEVDLQIKADSIQLKAFLNAMKGELCPQMRSKEEPLKNDNKLLRAFGSSPKMIEKITKLVIQDRSQFPTKGFPRTLLDLTINEVGCMQMPIGILNLTNLVSLDLSQNKMTKLHKSLGNLRLSKLIVGNNLLGESTCFKDWDWMDGENLRKTLKNLCLSNNCMTFIPANLFKLTELTTLDLSFNQISQISSAIRQLKQLRMLDLGNNQIQSFPYTITKLHLQSIELSSNPLPSRTKCLEVVRESHQNLTEILYRAPTLLELSSRKMIQKQIPFIHQNIPTILKEILIYSPLCCNTKCELLCFDMKILQNVNLIQIKANTVITTNREELFVVDGPFCSRSCQTQTTDRLLRNN